MTQWWMIHERRRGEALADRFCFGVEAESQTEAERLARHIRALERRRMGLKPRRTHLEAKPWPEGAS